MQSHQTSPQSARQVIKYCWMTIAIPSFSIGAGLQLLVCLAVIYDLADSGKVSVVSAFDYGATLPISVPAFAIGTAMLYRFIDKRRIIRILGVYGGSHVLVCTCGLLFQEVSVAKFS